MAQSICRCLYYTQIPDEQGDVERGCLALKDPCQKITSCFEKMTNCASQCVRTTLIVTAVFSSSISIFGFYASSKEDVPIWLLGGYAACISLITCIGGGCLWHNLYSKKQEDKRCAARLKEITEDLAIENEKGKRQNDIRNELSERNYLLLTTLLQQRDRVQEQFNWLVNAFKQRIAKESVENQNRESIVEIDEV